MKKFIPVFSIFIMILVLSLVAITAFWLVEHSFNSSTSNYRLASAFINRHFNKVVKVNKVVKAETLDGNSKASCTAHISKVEYDSLVDFLDANNMDSSFEARARLALEVGIINYKGLFADNKFLLNYLITKYSKENDCPPSVHGSDPIVALSKGLWQGSLIKIIKGL